MILIPPPLAGEARSGAYRLAVNGADVPVHVARVSEKYSRHPGLKEDYSFASVDADEALPLELWSSEPLGSLSVRSVGDLIPVELEGPRARLTLPKPGTYLVERNGEGRKGLLMIFVNPPEQDLPDPEDPGVLYYGPGRHDAGRILLTDRQTLYIAHGAVVTGKVAVRGDHVRICGRGLLENTHWDTHFTHMIQARGCRGLTLEGIVIRKHTRGWTVVIQDCGDVRVDRVKLCGSYIGNDDGIDPVNTRNMTVRDCFIRTNDDCFAFKGFHGNRRPCENILVERCMFWSDKCCSILIGDECQLDIIRNITIRDCFVPYLSVQEYPKKFLTVHATEEALIRDILLENIEIRGQGQDHFYMAVTSEFNHWCDLQKPGTLDGLTLRNLHLTGAPGRYAIKIRGYDEEHPVRNIHFDNCTLNGEKITPSSPNLELGPHVSGVRFT